MSLLPNIKEDVLQFFNDELNIEIDSPDIDLLDEGVLDSLTFVQLLYHFEQKYDIEMDIDELDLDSLRTIERIAGFISSQNGIKKT